MDFKKLPNNVILQRIDTFPSLLPQLSGEEAKTEEKSRVSFRARLCSITKKGKVAFLQFRQQLHTTQGILSSHQTPKYQELFNGDSN
jgi:hypothetical protein